MSKRYFDKYILSHNKKRLKSLKIGGVNFANSQEFVFFANRFSKNLVETTYNKYEQG